MSENHDTVEWTEGSPGFTAAILDWKGGQIKEPPRRIEGTTRSADLIGVPARQSRPTRAPMSEQVEMMNSGQYGTLMLEFDTQRLPPKVSAIIGLRGKGSIPLVWSECPIRTLKSSLDQAQDDCYLFGSADISDPSAAAAVRALLYVWGGWPSEAVMHAALTDEPASTYLNVFCLRQASETDSAKELLTAIGAHPIHPALAEFARALIGERAAASLKRVNGVLEFGEQWEPFFFADVLEQSRSGEFNDADGQIVSGIQRREFELLLVHCLEAALGRKLNAFRDSRAEVRRPRPRPRPSPVRRPAARPDPPAAARDGRSTETMSKIGAEVTVVCPSCRTHEKCPR